MKEFKKSDLKTGMRVELKNGEKYVVLANTASEYFSKTTIFANLDESGYLFISSYDDELKSNVADEFTIAKICVPVGIENIINLNCEEVVIWERKQEYVYSQEEKNFIKGLLLLGYRYAARDNTRLEELYVYTEKPTKETYNLCWTTEDDGFLKCDGRFSNLLKNIKWEDDEPLDLTTVDLN